MRKITKQGQMKIQEMAFVLVAIILFFAIASLFYISFRSSSLKSDVSLQRGEEAKELVRKISAMPEFSWTATQCESCVDLDKIMVLKGDLSYKNFWDMGYLAVEFVYPNKSGECDKSNYPDCGIITLVNKSLDFGTPERAYVSLCRQEFKQMNYVKCELGRISASGKGIQ